MNPENTLLYQFHAQEALLKVPKICNVYFWILELSESSSDLVAPYFPNFSLKPVWLFLSNSIFVFVTSALAFEKKTFSQLQQRSFLPLLFYSGSASNFQGDSATVKTLNQETFATCPSLPSPTDSRASRSKWLSLKAIHKHTRVTYM